MKIKDATFFKTIRDFLTVYLPKQKCASPNTIKSYRESLNLLLKFLEEKKKNPTPQGDILGFGSQNHRIFSGLA